MRLIGRPGKDTAGLQMRRANLSLLQPKRSTYLSVINVCEPLSPAFRRQEPRHSGRQAYLSVVFNSEPMPMFTNIAGRRGRE